MRRGRVTTGVLLWLVAAAAATAVGMTAVSAIGTDIFGDSGTPLSQSEVDDQLASRTSSTSTPPPTTTTTTTPPPTAEGGPERTATTAGGTVIARCVPGGVRILQAVPAQGFRVDPDDDEVDDHPSVKFQSGDREIEVRFRCVDGIPQPEIEDD